MFIFVVLYSIAPASAASAPQYPQDQVSAQSAMLLDADSGKILFSKNADEKVYPASTTKILTALIVLDNVADLDTIVTVGQEVTPFTASSSLLSPQLQVGEQISVKDLLYGMTVASGNECASALAVYVAGSESNFVAMMNNKAKEIGMENTNFTNPHGTHNENHYTTAADMAKLAIYAYQNKDYMEICGTHTYTIPATNMSPERNLVSSNRMFLVNDFEEDQEIKSHQPDYLYEYATGMKTGTTPYSFNCLVGSASKDGMNLIVLIYGDNSDAKTGEQRWSIAKNLFEFGFNNFKTYKVADLISNTPIYANIIDIETDDIIGLAQLAPSFDKDYYYTTHEDISNAVITAALRNNNIKAPFSAGDTLTTAGYYINGERVCGVPAKALSNMTAEDVEELKKQPLSYVWLWFLIPGVIIIFLVVRAVLRPHMRNKRYRRHRRMKHRRY